MKKTNEKFKGYFAVYEPSVIYKYNDELDRSKLCKKYHGKRVRIEDGNSKELYEILEQWVTLKRKIKFKVETPDNTKYFSKLELAEVNAIKLKTKVEEINLFGNDVKSNRQLKYEIVEQATEKLKTELTVEVLSAKELNSYVTENIEKMTSFIQNIKATRTLLANELSIVDQKKLDIDHKIELTVADASTGYKLYKKSHDIMIERREIKDNIKRLELIIGSNLGDNLQVVTKNIAEYTENREYRPRILKELFN